MSLSMRSSVPIPLRASASTTYPPTPPIPPTPPVPVEEKTGLDYASEVPGRMHACGHDMHTAVMLGTARLLKNLPSFDGGALFDPHYKSDYNPELLCSVNYICHLSMISRELIEKAGGFDTEYEGAQDYDFFLRCIEEATAKERRRIENTLDEENGKKWRMILVLCIAENVSIGQFGK